MAPDSGAARHAPSEGEDVGVDGRIVAAALGAVVLLLVLALVFLHND